ncbi:hypothetical protein WS67_05825 [Burkholderia singularis]|uniref:Uncharacterized protein n=1 Tax=Burkholderia singularis TaxID=1503053 RepID=A0A103E6P5_9BURK|nr:hypothetical protein [Burkholderia singularis]KVE29367.1 hypothetical protein WS67_05825 [Burkholderia singularis]
MRLHQRSSRRMPDRHTRDASSPAGQSQPLERGIAHDARAVRLPPHVAARCAAIVTPRSVTLRHVASRHAGGTDLAVAICGAHVGI